MKDGAGLADTLQHLPVALLANRVGGDQPGPLRPPGLDLGAGFLKPVANQIGPTGDAAGVSLTQRSDIILAQFSELFLIAQKRRIADDELRLRPGGLAAIGIQQRIPAFDGMQRPQNRPTRHVKTIAAHPLDFPDPHCRSGQFGGKQIDLDALHALWPHGRKLPVQPERLLPVQPERLGVYVDAMLEILESLQPQIQKIARPAGRIQNPHLAQSFQKTVVQGLGGLSRLGRDRALAGTSLVELRRDWGPDALPLRLQGPDDDRLHQQHDLVTVGVVRP